MAIINNNNNNLFDLKISDGYDEARERLASIMATAVLVFPEDIPKPNIPKKDYKTLVTNLFYNSFSIPPKEDKDVVIPVEEEDNLLKHGSDYEIDIAKCLEKSNELETLVFQYCNHNQNDARYIPLCKKLNVILCHNNSGDLRKNLLNNTILMADFFKAYSDNSHASILNLIKNKKLDESLNKGFVCMEVHGIAVDMPCPKCLNKTLVITSQQQQRSADEPATVFYACQNCPHKFNDGGQ